MSVLSTTIVIVKTYDFSFVFNVAKFNCSYLMWCTNCLIPTSHIKITYKLTCHSVSQSILVFFNFSSLYLINIHFMFFYSFYCSYFLLFLSYIVVIFFIFIFSYYFLF